MRHCNLKFLTAVTIKLNIRHELGSWYNRYDPSVCVYARVRACGVHARLSLTKYEDVIVFFRIIAETLSVQAT